MSEKTDFTHTQGYADYGKIEVSIQKLEPHSWIRVKLFSGQNTYVLPLSGNLTFVHEQFSGSVNRGEIVCFPPPKLTDFMKLGSESAGELLVLQVDPGREIFTEFHDSSGISFGKPREVPGFLSRMIHNCIASKEITGERNTVFSALYHKIKKWELAVLLMEVFAQETLPEKQKNISVNLEKMRQIEVYLRSAPEKTYTLRALAAHIGSNVTFVKTNFKRVYGQTTFAMLTQFRMEKALDLLNNSTLTIEAIAQEVGYKHGTHFSAAFRKYYGTLPKNLKSKR